MKVFAAAGADAIETIEGPLGIAIDKNAIEQRQRIVTGRPGDCPIAELLPRLKDLFDHYIEARSNCALQRVDIALRVGKPINVVDP